MVSYHDLVEKQRTFFKSGGLRCLSKRREVLQKVKQMIEEGAEEITSSIYKDLHRDGGFEVYMISRAIDEALEKLDEWTAPSKLPVSVPLDASTDDLYIVREPLGVVLVIAPWNYPLATSVPFVQALAAGNTIVWKPSELAPHFADTVEKLVKKHFDETVISVVNGGVPETTELLKERFDHIIYTGCPAVAKVVMSAAAKHLTPVTLELGGKNPTVVLDDADLNLAAAKIVGAKLMNCGQICINPDYILTTEETKPKLVSAIKEAFEKKGNLHENAEFARIINQRHFDRLSELVTKTKGKLMWQAAGEPNREEKFLPPRVYEIEKEDELMKDEIFGPVVPIVTIKNLDEAIRFVQDNEKPLAAYIFSKCPDAVSRFVKETWSGGVCVNDVQTHGFASGVPFGGVGNSGMGRINGKYSFDNFTHEKTVLFRGGVGKDIAANKL